MLGLVIFKFTRKTTRFHLPIIAIDFHSERISCKLISIKFFTFNFERNYLNYIIIVEKSKLLVLIAKNWPYRLP